MSLTLVGEHLSPYYFGLHQTRAYPEEGVRGWAAKTLLEYRKGQVSVITDVQRELNVWRVIIVRAEIGQDFREKLTLNGTMVVQIESSKRRWQDRNPW